MDNNKVYITLVVRATVASQFIAGVGCRIFNVNLLSFLKQNYYKYEAFNIKEGDGMFIPITKRVNIW